jgi:hypothetical protein
MRAAWRISMTASSRKQRVHVIFPAALIDEIDALVGQRKRSQFIEEAAEEKLRQERLPVALSEMAGSLADVDIPGWETPESAAAWVRALRAGQPVGVSTNFDDEKPTGHQRPHRPDAES